MAAPSKSFTNLTYAFGSLLTSTKMTQLMDNTTHLEEWLGDAYVAAKDHDHDGVNSKEVVTLGAGSVGQGELNSATGSVSNTGGGWLLSTLPGGTYGFDSQIRMNNTVGVARQACVKIIGGTAGGSGDNFYNKPPGDSGYVSYISLYGGSADIGIYAQQRYITASAPFNLGNGDIPLFIFATVDNVTGNIEATYVADTPPWFYNGRPENTFDAKKYKKKKGKKNYFYDRPLPLPDKKADFAAYLEAIANPQYEEIEITPEMKNLDMDIIPHPFTGNDLTGKSVVLLDPVGSMAEKMRMLHDMGESVADLLYGGYLLIDNEIAGANSPVGVKTHKVKWK